MKERLEEVMKLERLTSVKLAEILGVQPSNISHIISGRNNPSYDFITKFIERFPHINAEWIITGKGSVYKSNSAEPSVNVTNVIQDDFTDVNAQSGKIFTGDYEATIPINSKLADDTFVTHDLINEVGFTQNHTQLNQLSGNENQSRQPTPTLATKPTVIDSPADNPKVVDRVILIYSDNSFEILKN